MCSVVDTLGLCALSFLFTQLLVRWGVRVRLALISPAAQDVQALRGREHDKVVWQIQADYLIPGVVVEELLQGAPWAEGSQRKE